MTRGLEFLGKHSTCLVLNLTKERAQDYLVALINNIVPFVHCIGSNK